MGYPVFDNAWYAEIIGHCAAPPDAPDRETANAIVTAACIIAQALDDLAKAIRSQGEQP